MPSTAHLRSRGLREAWWVAALAIVAVGLFSLGLVVGTRCRLHGCTSSRGGYLALDSIGGLPRLFTTGLFVAVAVVGCVAARRATGRARTWWTAAAGLGGVLAVLKLVSAHSIVKADSAAAALVAGVALSAVALTALWGTARRWEVPAGAPVVVGLGIYAFAAIGLDGVSGLVAILHGTIGVELEPLSTFVEELGEALAALLVLASVWWSLPEERRTVRRR